MSEIVGRLAPSPTGVLHLGNARSFLLAWLSVRSQNGRILLRIEDLDGPRVKAGAEDLCLQDLQWLGLDWDGEVMRQSQRAGAYQQALSALRRAKRVYPCSCSRKEIERAASAPHAGEEGPVYPGTCRHRSAMEVEKECANPAFRFHVQPGHVHFVDGFCGPCSLDVEQELGDFVVFKRDGFAAYQLAVVVDDAATGVNEVVRGDDLLSSAARQIQLMQALHLPLPKFYHLPLVIGTDGKRLAKRHGDTSLRFFREQGVHAEQILGWLAQSAGLQADAHPRSAEELIAGFRWEKIPPYPVLWTGSFSAKMQWLVAGNPCQKPPHKVFHNRS